MTTIILDTDFLSSFLKIERLGLVKAFFQVESLHVPSAVYREIAHTDLLPRLLAIKWIVVRQANKVAYEALYHDEAFAALGEGEQESMLLALDSTDAVLMMSDNQARRVARTHGIRVLNIPAFLRACKMAGMIERKEIAQIIRNLKEKDYYKFKHEVREALLK